MLAQLKARVRELNTLADEVFILAERFGKEDATAQPDLAIKGQQWFRGARELLVQQKYSGLKDFDLCYSTPNNYMDIGRYLNFDLSEYTKSGLQDAFRLFKKAFWPARLADKDFPVAWIKTYHRGR